MRKTLAALAFGVSLLANPNAASSDGDYNPSQKLCEALKSFMDKEGFVKNDYFLGEIVYADHDLGRTYHSKGYVLNGTPFTEVRDLDVAEEGRVKESYEESQFNKHPFLFGFPNSNLMFFDYYRDGCNGNEVIIEDSYDAYSEKLKRFEV